MSDIEFFNYLQKHLRGTRTLSLAEFCLKTGLDAKAVEEYVFKYEFDQRWRNYFGYESKHVDSQGNEVDVGPLFRRRKAAAQGAKEVLTSFKNYTYTSPSRTLDLWICKNVFGCVYKFGDYETYEEYNSSRRGWIIDPDKKYQSPFSDDEVPYFSTDAKLIPFLLEKLGSVEVFSKNGYVVRSRSFSVKHSNLSTALTRLLFLVWSKEK